MTRQALEGARMKSGPAPAQTARLCTRDLRRDSIRTPFRRSPGTAIKGFSPGNYNESFLARSTIAIITAADRGVTFANLMPDYGSRTLLSVYLVR